MGGGANASPPVDVAPGGGTFPTDAFGTAYNPEWYTDPAYGQMGYGGIGKGLQQFGAGIAGGSQPSNYMTGAPQMPSAGIPQGGSQGAGLIPTGPSGGLDPQIIQAILQLLGGGGGY